MPLGKLRREIERAAARGNRLLQVFRRRIEVLVQKRAAVGYAAVRQRVARVQLDRALEQLAGKLMGPASMLVEELASAEVILVGIDVGSRYLLDGLFLVVGENDPKRRDDAGCDLVLDCKYVLQLAVITLGPELGAVSGAHELCVQPKALSCFPDAALENRRHLQLAADL